MVNKYVPIKMYKNMGIYLWKMHIEYVPMQ